VIPPDPTFASPAVNVPPPDRTHLQEPTTSSSAVATSLPGQVCFTSQVTSAPFYIALLTRLFSRV
jgi:hypothetical protein